MLRRVLSVLLSTVLLTTVIAPSAQAGTKLTRQQLVKLTDQYLFDTDLDTFLTIRAGHPHDDQFDWTSDGCTLAPDRPLGFNFLPACLRHDFGYGNYKRQGRFDEDVRKDIDDNFRDDLYDICHGNLACVLVANIYYAAVRAFGGAYGRIVVTQQQIEQAQSRAVAIQQGQLRHI
ncbi:phospholipase [Pseudonocardiaceae bacterium YIM PH 21723]|nr:phospholipase [Pseudonocardiaceae bacterium YIM PH 21723]